MPQGKGGTMKDERAQRAKTLWSEWQEERAKSRFNLGQLSKRERFDFFVEIVVWWSCAALFLTGAAACIFLLGMNPLITPIGRLGFGLGIWTCLFIAAWALRSPWRRAKARYRRMSRDDAPATPPNPYGEE